MIPEQLSVGVPGATTTKATDIRERIEEAKRSGRTLLVVAADLSNAHSEFCRERAQKSIMDLVNRDPSLAPLIRAHAVLDDTNSPIYVRDPGYDQTWVEVGLEVKTEMCVPYGTEAQVHGSQVQASA